MNGSRQGIMLYSLVGSLLANGEYNEMSFSLHIRPPDDLVVSQLEGQLLY